jgi:hypothetical protein
VNNKLSEGGDTFGDGENKSPIGKDMLRSILRKKVVAIPCTQPMPHLQKSIKGPHSPHGAQCSFCDPGALSSTSLTADSADDAESPTASTI